MTPDNKPSELKISAKAGLLDWVSPFGVITEREMLIRAVVVTFILFAPLIVHQMMFSNASDDSVEVMGLGAGVAVTVPLFFIVLVATLTKHYRTAGVKAPYVFAVLTPVLPFMFIAKWLFSSRELGIHNTRLAQEQYALRQAPKARQTKVKTSQEPETVVRRRRS